MALAVAMVACSAAAGKPGPAGPKGDTGEPGEPATTPEPGDTPTVEPGPVQMIKGIDPFIFNDSATGDVDKVPETRDVSGSFYPSAGLMFSIDGHIMPEMERFDATITDDGMLTVTFKDSAYQDDMIGVKATDGTSSDTIAFSVRRNRAPRNPIGTADSSAAADATNTRPDAIAIWVGSSEDESVPTHNVVAGEATAVPAGQIPIVIGSRGANLERFFFQDDAGNKLNFVSDLSVSDAKRLMVTDEEMKVTLRGKKTTFYDGPDADADAENNSITVRLSAVDDGGLVSDDEESVLVVHIDVAPTTKGNIGTKVITLGTTEKDRVFVPNIVSYFEDDRQRMSAQDQDTDGLDYYVWSDDPKVASVSINQGNSDSMQNDLVLEAGTDGSSDVTGGFFVEGKGRGTAMIMVKATEDKSDGATDLAAISNDAGTAALGQSVTLSFMVEVK